MSWSTSQYDENPFSDNSTHPEAKLIPKQGAPIAGSAKLETPPWLQDNSPKNGSPAPSPTNEQTPASQPVDAAIPRMILYTRVINLVLSVSMIIVSMLSLLTTQSATTGVLACYVVVFSCLLCCFETHLKQVSKFIAMNFGFMYSAKSRSVFMLFIGTILFSFSLFGKLIGLCMLVNAAFNIFILFRYPEFEDTQRIDAQSEIKDYLAANPAFASKIFDVGVKTGTELITRNPDIARQGANAILTAHVNSMNTSTNAGPTTAAPPSTNSKPSWGNYSIV